MSAQTVDVHTGIEETRAQVGISYNLVQRHGKATTLELTSLDRTGKVLLHGLAVFATSAFDGQFQVLQSGGKTVCVEKIVNHARLLLSSFRLSNRNQAEADWDQALDVVLEAFDDQENVRLIGEVDGNYQVVQVAANIRELSRVSALQEG